jgi:hypothetical protein
MWLLFSFIDEQMPKTIVKMWYGLSAQITEQSYRMMKTWTLYDPLLGHHHLDEFFVVDLSVSINIGLTDHLINLLVGELLTKVGHDMTQFGGRDETVAILIEDLECFEDLLFTISVLHLASHHCEEFWEVNSSRTVGINLG